jgi:hypothetical protein
MMMSTDKPYWFVTIQKTGSSKVHQRRLQADTIIEAGDLTRALIGGPDKDQFTVLRCVEA